MPLNLSESKTLIETNVERPREDDEQEHNPLVTAIRDGKLIPIHWNDLTQAEQHAAYVSLFDPCGINNL